jgi:molecular chaperone DnaJ
MAGACPTCQGAGTTTPKSSMCKPCDGRGIVHERKSIKVDIPPGVNTGTRIRLSGKGNASPGRGPSGDLYLDISVS